MGVWQKNSRGAYYTDATVEVGGRQVRRTICTEQKTKEHALRVEGKIRQLQAQQTLGLAPNGELMAFINQISAKMRKRLVGLGLLNGQLASLSKDARSHVEDWLAAADFDPVHEGNRRSQLNAIIVYVGATRLLDLTAERVTPFLVSLTNEQGLSARTRNSYRDGVAAFMNWCVRQGRIPSHTLGALNRANEKKDRRRQRRSATEEELRRFISGVAPQRRAKYLTLLFTGLRTGELKQLIVGDIDFQTHCLRVPAEIDKEEQDCHIPLHPELEKALRECISSTAMPSDRLFDSVPTRRTFYRDLEHTGINRKDERGFQLDLHALRRTMATRLLRAGVTASHAKLLTRHASTAVLEKHYNDLHLPDATAAMHRLEWIGEKPVADSSEDRGESAAPSAARKPLKLAVTSEALPEAASNAPSNLEICRALHCLYNSAAGTDMREDAPIDIGILRKVLSAHGFRAIGAVG